MRYTIHGEQLRAPWSSRMRPQRRRSATGATALYIYDDETDEAYWPNEFAGLFKVRASEAAHPEAPTRDPITCRRRRSGSDPRLLGLTMGGTLRALLNDEEYAVARASTS
jgi:hypothetical protein